MIKFPQCPWQTEGGGEGTSRPLARSLTLVTWLERKDQKSTSEERLCAKKKADTNFNVPSLCSISSCVHSLNTASVSGPLWLTHTIHTLTHTLAWLHSAQIIQVMNRWRRSPSSQGRGGTRTHVSEQQSHRTDDNPVYITPMPPDIYQCLTSVCLPLYNPRPVTERTLSPLLCGSALHQPCERMCLSYSEHTLQIPAVQR